MSRLILTIAAGFAVLSVGYLGAVSLLFSPPDMEATAAAETASSEDFGMPPRADAPPPAPPSEDFAMPPRADAPPPATPATPQSIPARPVAPAPDSSAAAPDSAAVRRLTIQFARQTREVAHVGKPVAAHVASGPLGLGDDGCKTTAAVQLCLSTASVGGWKIVGSSGGYAVTARGPATLGEPLRISVD